MTSLPSLLLALAALPQTAEPTTRDHHLVLEPTVRVADVERFGINVGAHAVWGSGHVLRNLVENPGFESGVYGMVVHTRDTSTGDRISQAFWQTRWNNDEFGIGQPEGFWNGATWEIVDGPAEGRSGTVLDYVHENDDPIFVLDSDGTTPDAYDVMFVRTDIPGLDHAGEFASAAPGITRPNSPGLQSMRLVPSGASWKPSWVLYLDSLWQSQPEIGKLLLVEGQWSLDVWARASADNTPLRILFRRQGEAVFLDETITLNSTWTRIQRTVDVAPGTDPKGPYGPDDDHPLVELQLLVPDDGTEVFIDDMVFGRSDETNPTAFADPLVDSLRRLRPGILRNFSEVHGDTLAEQLASPFARRTHGFRPDERVPEAMDYGLHEFLQLCAYVGSDPWLVIPVVFSTDDLEGLVEYLAGPADGQHPWADLRAARGRVQPWTETFGTIHLEYGNEAWGGGDPGDPYFGSSLLGGTRLGRIADDRLTWITSSPWYDATSMRLIIGGQAEFTGRQSEIESRSSKHDVIGLAPYFGRKLDDYATEAERYLPLWAHALEDVSSGGKLKTSQEIVDSFGQGTELAIYELNFQTIRSHAGLPTDVRESFVAGGGGALAMPLYMLHYLRDLGIRHQCAFQALEYSVETLDGDRTPLFGLIRDVYATSRVRPTYLGLELVNQGLAGDLITARWIGDVPTYVQSPSNDVEQAVTMPTLQAFPFQQGIARSLVLFNLDLNETQTVRVSGISPNPPLASVMAICPDDLGDTNEAGVTVESLEHVIGFGAGQPLHLPPHSIALVRWVEL